MTNKQKIVCFDTQACIKCFSCVINCGVENRARLERKENKPAEKLFSENPSYINYLTINQSESGSFPNVKNIAALKHCMHCENPHCEAVCPTKAITKDASGAVVIDQTLCVGCRACKDACPFDVPAYSKETGRTYKCIMCYDRLTAGLPTACSAACPSVAMISGDAETVLKEAKERAANYELKFGKPFIVYGAEPLSSSIGTLRFITIAPKEDMEAYMLPENPSSKSHIVKNIIKGATIGGAAVIAGAIGLHIKHWKSKKDDSVYNNHGE